MYVTALLLQYATAVPLRFANAADVSLTLELGPLVGQIFVMIIYDKSQYIKILFTTTRSPVYSAVPYAIVGAWYASIVLTLHALISSKKDDLDTEIPPLSAIAFCAGYMLSIQCSVAYQHYETAISSLMDLEATCLEMMRHSTMLLDDHATLDLKHEIRRVLLATLTCIFVDIRTAAANDTLTQGLGRESLRRAHKVGILRDAEYEATMSMTPKLATYAITSEVQRKVLLLMYAEQYAPWRAAMRNEKTLQPIVNFVKLLDSHWKVMISIAVKMRGTTQQAAPLFPVAFVQMSRLMWMLAIAAFPWDIVDDMHTFALITTGMFVWAYFTLDIIATDFANPFGFHPHCAPFDALLARMEDASYSILMGFPVESSSGEDSTAVVPAAVPRYDMVYVTKPLLNGSTVRTMQHQKNAPLAGDEEEGMGGVGVDGAGGEKSTAPGGRKKRRRLSTIGLFKGPTQEQIAAAQDADNEHHGETTTTTSPPPELADKPTEGSKPVRRLSRILKGRSKANAVEPWGPDTEGATGAEGATTVADGASNPTSQPGTEAGPNGVGDDAAVTADLTPEQMFAADAEAKATDASSKAEAASAKRKEELETAVAFEDMLAGGSRKSKGKNNNEKEVAEEEAVSTPRAAATTSGGPSPGSGSKL